MRNSTIFIFLCLLIYFEERASVGEGQREREGERESQAGFMLLAQSATWGLISQTTR